MKQFDRLVSFALITLFLTIPASAQIQQVRGVFGSGAGGGMSANNSLNGTLGQPVIGRTALAGSWEHGIGFWYGPQHPTDVGDQPGLPAIYELMQNRPNPFNPVTSIRYAVPSASRVVLRLYDIRGRVVRTLIDEEQGVGWHEYVLKADGLSSGVYFYQMESADFRETKKLVLLK